MKGTPAESIRARWRLTFLRLTLACWVPLGCSVASMAGAPQGPTYREQLAQLEQRYADTRDLYAQSRITEARGADRSTHNSPIADLKKTYEIQRQSLLEALVALDSSQLSGEDARAYHTMRASLSDGAMEASTTPTTSRPACTYDPNEVASGEGGRQKLSERIYDCYGRMARRVIVGRDTLDRLTVLGKLGTEDDSAVRRAHFVALGPVWQAMNGDGRPNSPYRTLVALSARDWQKNGSYIARQAESLGLDSSRVESSLVRILEAWRDHTPTTLLQPWDWWYANGASSRRLSSRISKDELRVVNDRFYADLGADPKDLDIHYDLDPRDGKTPVAFTDFGSHPRARRGQWTRAEAWIFATYRVGGIDNLGELLHESGHAVHIAAIKTRPAFADWPDSDPYTEALGDLIALDLSEPAWQRKYLGDSATTSESMRGRYSGIAMDVAWALFELRMHAVPSRDPNVVWTDITSTYLHIVPHPEWSWWAMRGQLVDLPGYMMNYALGAIITADLRARVLADRGAFHNANKKTYGWLSDRLYKWGLERPTRDVLRDFLGRSITPAAILQDMERLGAH